MRTTAECMTKRNQPRSWASRHTVSRRRPAHAHYTAHAVPFMHQASTVTRRNDSCQQRRDLGRVLYLVKQHTPRHASVHESETPSLRWRTVDIIACMMSPMGHT